jgi:hypothetical protein
MEGYKSLDEYGTPLPVLVLAIDQHPNRARTYNFKPDRQWLPVRHQTAGYACNQRYMDATILTPKTPEKLKTLTNEYLESCIAMWALTLDEAIAYRQRLNQLFGVDCNVTFMSLEEGIYPIDPTSENLQQLCVDNLPDDLDDLIAWSNSWDKYFGCLGRWKVYILGENCD